MEWNAIRQITNRRDNLFEWERREIERWLSKSYSFSYWWIYDFENYKVFEYMLFYSTTSLTLSTISHSLSSTDIPFNN